MRERLSSFSPSSECISLSAIPIEKEKGAKNAAFPVENDRKDERKKVRVCVRVRDSFSRSLNSISQIVFPFVNVFFSFSLSRIIA